MKSSKIIGAAGIWETDNIGLLLLSTLFLCIKYIDAVSQKYYFSQRASLDSALKVSHRCKIGTSPKMLITSLGFHLNALMPILTFSLVKQIRNL